MLLRTQHDTHNVTQKYFENASKGWDERKLSMVLAERAKGQSIASSKFLASFPKSL